eukprot:4995176-Pyramimonas_sp.AAC.1
MIARALRWPDEFLVNLVHLMFVSKQAVRPIAPMQALHMCWSRARRCNVAGMSPEEVQSWDGAVAGSSSLTVTAFRRAKLEIAILQQFLWERSALGLVGSPWCR